MPSPDLQPLVDVALQLLPSLYERRKEWRAEGHKLTATISSLEDILGANDVELPTGAAPSEQNNEPKTAPTELVLESSPQAQPKEGTKQRAERGAVFVHVHQLMMNGFSGSRVALSEALKQRFGESYGSTTVYRALSRGLQRKDYKVVNGIWSAEGPNL